MKANETKLIACSNAKTLTAYGYKLMNRIIDKAAESNGTHRRHKEFREMKEKVKELVMALIFEQHITAENLSKFNAQIKVQKNEPLSVTTSEVFISKY